MVDFGIKLAFLLKIDHLSSGLSIRLVARHESFFVHSPNRLYVFNCIKRNSQRWFYFSKSFWIYNSLICTIHIEWTKGKICRNGTMLSVKGVFSRGLAWPGNFCSSKMLDSGWKLIVKFFQVRSRDITSFIFPISALLQPKCITFYKPLTS